MLISTAKIVDQTVGSGFIFSLDIIEKNFIKSIRIGDMRQTKMGTHIGEKTLNFELPPGLATKASRTFG